MEERGELPDRYFLDRHDPEPLADVVSSFVESAGLARMYANRELIRAWQEAAGEEIAEHTAVIGVSGQKQRVSVDSSAWLQEIRDFYKDDILGRLQSMSTRTYITEVVFEVGEV